MTTWVINISGLLLMVAIIGWFWLYRPAATVKSDAAEVKKQ